MTTTEKGLNDNYSLNNSKISARMFMVTVNEQVMPELHKIINYLKERAMCNYGIVCSHNKGHKDTTKEHVHIVVQFTNATRLSIKKMCGAHIDVGKYGSIQAMRDYVMGKTGHSDISDFQATVIDEWGELNPRGGKTIKEVKEMSREERENLPVQYYNIISRINEKEVNDIDLEDWHKTTKVVYIEGDSGVGKTELAKKLVFENLNNEKITNRRHEELTTSEIPKKVNIVKKVDSFYHGVGEIAKVAIYDDFRDSHMSCSEFINFIDYNTHNLNVKGGSVKNQYNLIIITSIQPLDNLYYNVDDEPKEQIKRRIDEHYKWNSSLDKFEVIIPKNNS